MPVNNNDKEINYGQIMKHLRRKIVIIPQIGDYRQSICIESLGWYTAYLTAKFPEFTINQIRAVIAEKLLNMELSLEYIRNLQRKVQEATA